MIIKGVKIIFSSGYKQEIECTLDIPDDVLRQLIREEIKLDKAGMTLKLRPGDTIKPEERSCETCTCRIRTLDFSNCPDNVKCFKCGKPINPKPQEPDDAMAREWRKGNDAIASGNLSRIITAFFDLNKAAETALTEERELSKSYRQSIKSEEALKNIFIRRLEEAETRYGVAEADRNREIERREEAERKLAKYEFTDDDIWWAVNQTRYIISDAGHWYLEQSNEFKRRLAARREERKPT